MCPRRFTASLSLLFSVPVLLCAQSLIGQARMKPDASNPASPRNVGYAGSQVNHPPLPRVEIPTELPTELRIPADQFADWSQMVKATQHMRAGKAEEAITIYRAILKTHPEDTLLQVHLADALLFIDAHREAEALYLKVLDEAPFQFQALNNLAWMYATVKEDSIYNPEKALELASRARALNPNSHFIWSTLSHVHYELGQYPEARRAAQNALVLFRQSPTRTVDFIRYQVQLEKCTAALQATSLLE